MAIRKRQVTGTFYLGTGKPAVGKSVTVELTENDFTLDGSIQKTSITIDLDENASIPQDPDPFLLWCNEDGLAGSEQKWTEPDGTVWYAILEYGDGSAISKDTLRATGRVVVNKTTVQKIIEAVLDVLLPVRAILFSTEQDLSAEEQAQGRANLGITQGGIPSVITNESPTGVINGVNVTFISSQNFIPESVQVLVNGLSQQPVVDFTTSGNNQINLLVAPEPGESVLINYLIL